MGDLRGVRASGDTMHKFLFDIWVGAANIQVDVFAVDEAEAQEALWTLYPNADSIYPL